MPVKLQRSTLSRMIKIATALDEKGPMTKSEVAEYLDMSRQSVSRIMDLMCAEKFRSHGYEFQIERDNHKRVGEKKTPAQLFRVKELGRWLF